MTRESIFREIAAERQRQDDKWGGLGHDDTHTSNDWVSFLTKHMGKAITFPWDPQLFRHQMVRVAALAVAAIEWHDRNKSMWTDK